MPVDTRVKRLSMLNFGGEGISHLLLPDVSGAFDQGDRQTLLDCYSGILFAGGAPVTAVDPLRPVLGLSWSPAPPKLGEVWG